MIRLKPQENEGVLLFEISRHKSEVSLRLECYEVSNNSRIDLTAECVKNCNSHSTWSVDTNKLEGYQWVVHCDSSDFNELYGVIVKKDHQWICTNEYSDLSINYTSFSLTERCNMMCNMCWQSKNREKGITTNATMSLKDFTYILEKLKGLSMKRVFLWGGEPLLHPQIGQIIQNVKKRKMLCSLITNGLLLREKADVLLESKLDSMCISLDGLEQTHDTIRGIPGAYRKIMDGLEYINSKRNVRPVISVNLVINKSNYRNLYEIIAEYNKFQINSIQIQFPVYFSTRVGERSAKKMKAATGMDIAYWKGFVNDSNESNGGIDISILNQQIEMIKKEFPKVYFYPGDIPPEVWFSDGKEYRNIQCNTAWSRLNIDAKGNVIICNDHADMIAGNLLSEDLESIWNNEKFRSFRRVMRETNYMEMCQYCTYSYL